MLLLWAVITRDENAFWLDDEDDDELVGKNTLLWFEVVGIDDDILIPYEDDGEDAVDLLKFKWII